MTGIPKRKRSGGPKTEEGKQLTSANSIKTGAYSSMIVLPTESEQDFLDLQNQFVADFMPKDIAELSMVHELASILWKKLRLEKLEKSAFLQVLNVPCTSLDLYASRLRIPEEYDPYLANIEIFTDAFIANYKDFASLIGKVGTNPGKEEFFQLCQESPLLFKEIEQMVEAHYTFRLSNPNITPELVLSLEIQTDTVNVSFINYALKEIKNKTEDIAWVAERLERIKQAITNHKEQRLLTLMQSQGVMRARDELSRSFYRTLSELRKQQQWRLKMTAVDVTPVE